MTRRLVSPILIGRGAELAALRAAVDGREGDSRPVVLVLGDAGTGKSRLLDELRRSLDDGDPRHGTVFAIGHCILGVEGALPCAAILELLDDLQGAAQGGAVLRAIETARQLLLASPDAEAGTDTRGGAHAENPMRRLEAVLGAVHAVARDRRAVLAIDDIQWADAGTIELVAFLARRLARSRTVLLLACREREARLRPEIARCLADLEGSWLRDRVSIASLRRREALELVDAIAGAGIDRGRARGIAERAGGNPLFLEQLVAAEAEREAERDGDGDEEGETAATAANGSLPFAADPWHLSEREREVLTLVAAGRTNREIGDALFITEKTASSHVTHILDKLGVDSRVEAALAAAASGLVPGPEVDPGTSSGGRTFQGSPDDDRAGRS